MIYVIILLKCAVQKKPKTKEKIKVPPNKLLSNIDKIT